MAMQLCASGDVRLEPGPLQVLSVPPAFRDRNQRCLRVKALPFLVAQKGIQFTTLNVGGSFVVSRGVQMETSGWRRVGGDK